MIAMINIKRVRKKKKKKKKRKKYSSSTDNDNDDTYDEINNNELLSKEEKNSSSTISTTTTNDETSNKLIPETNSNIYGKNLLTGEGKAIATYVQKNERIPRRGEIGLTGTEIQQFENAGFVMSGSRHKKMNAIRIRKEKQVYSVEEQIALKALNRQEKKKRSKVNE